VRGQRDCALIVGAGQRDQHVGEALLADIDHAVVVGVDIDGAADAARLDLAEVGRGAGDQPGDVDPGDDISAGFCAADKTGGGLAAEIARSLDW
jgi:hypothetical protein